MSFKDLDNKIREAADRHQPSYNEDAWSRMEYLLDRDMPGKDGKRRPFIFWLMVFLIATPLLMIWLNQDDMNMKKNLTSQIKQEQPMIEHELKHDITAPVNNFTGNNDISRSETGIKRTGQQSSPQLPGNSNRHKVRFDPPRNTVQYSVEENHPDVASPALINSLAHEDVMMLPYTHNRNKVQPVAMNKGQASLLKMNLQPNPVQPVALVDVPGIKTSGIGNFLRNLSFTLTAGPSVSSVSLNEYGKVTPLYGAGIRYAITNKLSFNSGLYINTKIYSTGKEAYTPPAGYWTYYTDLLRVDADCRVLEWPVGLQYSIHRNQQHEWFAATSVSSYFMKKETYHYLYKDANGQERYRGWSMKNKHQHYFSMFTLSGGYQHHINEKISISIEPSIKLPLTGMGFGKIKFYEAGTLVSLQVKPFGQK